MTNEYELFKYCHSLISDENFSSTFTLEDINSDSCKYVDQGWNEYYTNTCEKYKKFINYIQSKMNAEHFNQNCKYDEFLNFWLHYQLSNEKSSNFDASSFYEFLTEKNPVFFAKHFNINIHDIQQVLFENMKKLYKLYQKYYDIYEISYSQDPTTGSKCISYANECVTLYRSFIKDCPTSHASSFCIALDDFKNTYDNLKSEGICGNTQLPPLPTYNDITLGQQELQGNRDSFRTDNRVTSDYISDSGKSQTSQKETPFAIIGTVFGVGLVLPSLYRFTSLGPWFRRLIQRNNITNEKLEEEIYPLLHNSESEYTNSDIQQYNIAYNSME